MKLEDIENSVIKLTDSNGHISLSHLHFIIQVLPKMVAVIQAARKVDYELDFRRDDSDDSYGLTSLSKALEELEKE